MCLCIGIVCSVTIAEQNFIKEKNVLTSEERWQHCIYNIDHSKKNLSIFLFTQNCHLIVIYVSLERKRKGKHTRTNREKQAERKREKVEEGKGTE